MHMFDMSRAEIHEQDDLKCASFISSRNRV
jgi:hypothetical protein